MVKAVLDPYRRSYAILTRAPAAILGGILCTIGGVILFELVFGLAPEWGWLPSVALNRDCREISQNCVALSDPQGFVFAMGYLAAFLASVLLKLALWGYQLDVMRQVPRGMYALPAWTRQVWQTILALVPFLAFTGLILYVSNWILNELRWALEFRTGDAATFYVAYPRIIQMMTEEGWTGNLIRSFGWVVLEMMIALTYTQHRYIGNIRGALRRSLVALRRGLSRLELFPVVLLHVAWGMIWRTSLHTIADSPVLLPAIIFGFVVILAFPVKLYIYLFYGDCLVQIPGFPSRGNGPPATNESSRG